MYLYEVGFGGMSSWDADDLKRTVKVVAVNADRALIAARKAIKRKTGFVCKVLEMRQSILVDGVDR